MFAVFFFAEETKRVTEERGGKKNTHTKSGGETKRQVLVAIMPTVWRWGGGRGELKGRVMFRQTPGSRATDFFSHCQETVFSGK